MAEGDERSLIEFGYYREGLQRFEYFIVGVSLALCAYVGQTLRPEKLIFLSPYTIEVVSLLLLVLSVVSGFKRIESLVQCSRLNARGLDAREKRGVLVAAQPDANGVVVNAISGEAFDRQTVRNSVRDLTATIKSVDERLQRESRRASQWYKMRNVLLFVGFCGLVLSKVLGPYLHTGWAALEFNERRQPFICTHNETLFLIAMRVSNPNRSPARINR